jgi:pimeloyl-ACP methyl ester carboxylesterase
MREGAVTVLTLSSGRKVRYEVSGSGEPVLLLHGIGRSLEDWSLVFDDFARSFTVYAVDLPGFGESDRVEARSDLIGLARGVLEFLEELGEQRPIRIIGNSLGGAVAMQLALMLEQVPALVLVDSAGFGREVTIGLRAIAIPVIGRQLLKPSRRAAMVQLRGIFYDHSLITDEQVERAYRLAQRPGRADIFVETGRTLGGVRGMNEEWRTELLGELVARDIPTLVVWGENDIILPASHLKSAAQAFPSARTHVFARSGHMPQLEHPDEFVEVVTAFLTEVDEKSTGSNATDANATDANPADAKD